MKINNLYKAVNIFLKLCNDNSFDNLLYNLQSKEIIKSINKDDVSEWYKLNQSILDKFLSIFNLPFTFRIDLISKNKFIFFQNLDELIILSPAKITEESLIRLFDKNDIDLIDNFYLRGINSIQDLYLYIIKATMFE